MIPLILGHVPAGSSTKQLFHFGQLTKVKRFQKFDYDKEENRVRYQSDIPPEYKLQNVRTKVSIHYADNDTIVLGTNVQRLIEQLPNVVASHNLKRKFHHFDFVWGKDVRKLIYDKMIKQMKNAGTSETKRHFRFLFW